MVLSAEEVEAAVRVYERASGRDDWEEIDYSETGFFVHTAESFRLEVVFVLDFTNSMAQARLPDGKSGIEAMIGAFESAALTFPDSHRIGVVEFHDRNVEPRVLSELTTDKDSVLASVRQFEQEMFDHGSSRVWDGVAAASDLFSDDPSAVRALVFLSDGRDTSSVRTREQAVGHAKGRKVQLYALGVGKVHQEDRLRSAVAETGGAYFPVSDITGLEDLLGIIVNNLRGHYKVSYVTLRRTGEYHAALSVALHGAEAWFETHEFDVEGFFGPDNRGVVQVDPPSIDRFSGQATFFMRALHIPRGVDRILFRLDTNNPVSVEIVEETDGGLLQGWALSGPDSAGWYDASSDESIEFGNSGPLFKLTIYNIDEQSVRIPLEFDNSIYAAGKEFSKPVYIQVGSVFRIAFVSDRDGNREIYTMNDDGSGLTRLTHNSANDNTPNWSPDGRRIAFYSNRDGGHWIYIMNSDGSGQTRLIAGTHPSWSPDGRRLAFCSGGDIYLVNIDGSGRTRLTDTPGVDWDPHWSPDGRRIAFHSKQGETRTLYVINEDGSGLTRLTDGGTPKWSPDGRRIAFNSSRDGDQEIYVINEDGSGLVRLTDNLAHDTNASWSPDGRYISFISDREIYMMNADGSGLIRLTHNLADDCCPIWSPE